MWKPRNHKQFIVKTLKPWKHEIPDPCRCLQFLVLNGKQIDAVTAVSILNVLTLKWQNMSNKVCSQWCYGSMIKVKKTKLLIPPPFIKYVWLLVHSLLPIMETFGEQVLGLNNLYCLNDPYIMPEKYSLLLWIWIFAM